ncbi:EYxxD motif small membrane protein [Pontibacillus salicampi]|uniref:EYxxD motif small membrane protein n=1 Tax=Pontibacillus salicampi TaxID=1449801 RepID=A0ABV6LMR6_9BACI
MNIMEYLTDMTFVIATIIGSIVAILFIYIQKRKKT